jgi:NAD(P)-dependent dehydrogenase (short-subunit alcohol dehydrogenase family)
MGFSFKNKRILLTGASRGIGLGAARLLLAQGASLMGTGKEPARIEATAKELSKLGDFQGVAADLSKPREAAQILAKAVASRWGALDILVNNAAIGGAEGHWEKAPAEDLETVLQVNLLAPQHLIHALLPFLRKGSEPRILNVSSQSGQFANQDALRGDPSYCLSKYALNGLTLHWAHALKGAVAVNTMHPGWVRSDMGGPNATDDLETGGRRILQALEKPFSESGKFYHGSEAFAW